MPREKPDEAAEEMVRKILRNSPKAVRTIKLLVNQGVKVDIEAGMKLETDYHRRMLGNINLDPDEDRDSRLRDFRKKRMSAKSFQNVYLPEKSKVVHGSKVGTDEKIFEA